MPTSESPPLPGLVHVEGGLVELPACALWPAHEAVAEPCWLAPAAREIDPHENVTTPSLAQLARAIALGLVAPPTEREQTCSELPGALMGGEVPVLVLGPGGAELGGAVRARQCLPLDDGRPRWRSVIRPVVPRHGRGAAWAAVHERLASGALGDEPYLLDVGERVVELARGEGYALVAAAPGQHSLGWVALSALGSPDEPDEPDASGEAEGPSEPLTGDDAASDAPVIDAMVALAEAALARFRGESAPQQPFCEAAARLLEVWGRGSLRDDERLAALAATDVLLLAIIAAPAFERALAQRYRVLAAPEPPLTVGLIADLAGVRASTRVRLHRRLGQEQPLRATGALLLSDTHDIPAASAEVSVAPWLLSALYC